MLQSLVSHFSQHCIDSDILTALLWYGFWSHKACHLSCLPYLFLRSVSLTKFIKSKMLSISSSEINDIFYICRLSMSINRNFLSSEMSHFQIHLRSPPDGLLCKINEKLANVFSSRFFSTICNTLITCFNFDHF